MDLMHSSQPRSQWILERTGWEDVYYMLVIEALCAGHVWKGSILGETLRSSMIILRSFSFCQTSWERRKLCNGFFRQNLKWRIIM
ncbi:hypothetical protein YC2023_014934 [Brassica napus]